MEDDNVATNHPNTHRGITRLALPLLLLSGCGETGDDASSPLADERITLTQLEVVGDEAAYLRHPLRVAVTAELSGEAFDADLVIGMHTLDGAEGCVLGAMKLDHGQDGEQLFEGESEFIVNNGCVDLVERDDVELFASFDPWDELGEGSDPVKAQAAEAAATESGIDLFAVVSASRLGTDACETCSEPMDLQPSPGVDTQLRELNLSSVVAVLPVPAPGRDTGAPTPSSTTRRPDFSLSNRLRVTGLDKGRGITDGRVHMSHRIRPASVSQGGGQGGWLPLLEQDPSGALNEIDPVSVSGPQDINRISALYIEGEAREAMIDGAWANIEEFELETCIHTDFDQAVYAGESEPRANDCGVLPVVVVREQLDSDGLPLPQAGAAGVRTTETYSEDWGWNNSTFGYSGVDFLAWLDVNASESATSTYGGIDVLGAGSWFEAGVRSTGTIFDYNINLIDIYATFIAYDAGGGGAAMGATIFWEDFIPPFEIQLTDGETVTLQDMFDAANLGIDPSLEASYSIVGVDFDDGCGNVTASMSAVGTLGIDTEETSITVDSTPTGAKVTGVVTPYLNMAAVAETSVSYGEYLSGGVAVTLNLLNISVPFTVTAELIFGNQGQNSLVLNESAEAIMTVLSGSITYWIKYSILLWTDTHEGTLLSWAGYTAPALSLFSLPETTISWNASAGVCGNGTCEWDEGDSCSADCGPSWMYADRVDVDENWVEVLFPYTFTDPVVIVGPPSYNGSDPAVVRVRNVTSTGFEIQAREWAYDDGDHAFEDVAWMVVEAGVHTAPDGSTWEVGTTLAGGDVDEATTTNFMLTPPTTPLLLASAQTANGSDPVSVRADNLSASSFDILLEEEEVKVDGHTNEVIGYVAISGPVSDWSDDGYAMYSATSTSVDENWENFASFQLKMQEETSLDSEVAHADETVNVLAMSYLGDGTQLIFALDVTNNGTDTASLRWR
jgi:hypothetical protein